MVQNLYKQRSLTASPKSRHAPGVWKTRIANSRKERIVPNSANGSEQWQIVANSDEQSSIVNALDLISSVN